MSGAALTLILAVSGSAWAGACDEQGGLPVGPAGVSLWDGGLGHARPVCGRTELAIAPRGTLLADAPAFYGRIVAEAAIEARVATPDGARTAVWLRLDPVRYESVLGAIPSSFLGIGTTSVGLTQRLDDPDGGGPVAVAFASELVLPTAVELTGNSWPVGFELAFAADTTKGAWSLHGQLGYVGSAAFTRGPSQLRTGFAGTVGAGLRAGDVFAVVLDVQTAVAYAAVLDHVAVAPGLRFGGGDFGLELAAALPLLGADRTLAAVELRTAVRF